MTRSELVGEDGATKPNCSQLFVIAIHDGLGQAPLRAGNCTSLEGRAGCLAFQLEWMVEVGRSGPGESQPASPVEAGPLHTPPRTGKSWGSSSTCTISRAAQRHLLLHPPRGGGAPRLL